MDGWEDGWMGGWMDGWMGGWVDGWMDGRKDGRMDGTGIAHAYASLGTREDSHDHIWDRGADLHHIRRSGPLQGQMNEMTVQAPWTLCPSPNNLLSIPSDNRWTFWWPG